MMPHPPLYRIHGKAFWQQFEELINLINVETCALVVVRGEINFLGVSEQK
jgi:hypothetical protein